MDTINSVNNRITVKLCYNEFGYNELGYNEHPVITNNKNTLGWFLSIHCCISPAITNRTRL